MRSPVTFDAMSPGIFSLQTARSLDDAAPTAEAHAENASAYSFLPMRSSPEDSRAQASSADGFSDRSALISMRPHPGQ